MPADEEGLDFDFLHLVESVCTRTQQVRKAIVDALGLDVSDCNDVTHDHLQHITILDLSNQGITSLKDNDFDGLHHVVSLDLSGNSLTSIPAGGRFGGLSTHRQAICGVDFENPGRRCNADGSYVSDEEVIYVYHGLAPLKTLDLSDNQISSLPGGRLLLADKTGGPGPVRQLVDQPAKRSVSTSVITISSGCWTSPATT